MAKFMRFPWAITGDRTPIPEPTEGSGAVSYAQGYGPDYEIAPGDPGWRPVPRPETNQLYYDLTDNIRQYQLQGVPTWYDASNNGGVAISYELNAVVRHDDKVWRSIVASNTVEPGTDPTKWAEDNVASAATETTLGLVRYATVAEAVARTANNRAVTPEGLGAVYNLLLNNPVFPDVVGGVFTVTSPGTGTIRIAAGTQWTHRGAFTYTSVLTDLATLASKTYHLRWTVSGGFALYDLSNGTYNPSAVAETNAVFDTTYDNMLIARVVTNGSNVATITTLANAAQLSFTAVKSTMETKSGGWPGLPEITGVTNWARTPKTVSHYNYNTDVTGGPECVVGFDIAFSRYSFSGMLRGYVIGVSVNDYISGAVTVTMGA